MALKVPASEENAEELEIIEGDGEEETDLLTLERAVSAYFDATAAKLVQNERVAVTRFVSWCGPGRGLQELMAGGARRRFEPLPSFGGLQFARRGSQLAGEIELPAKVADERRVVVGVGAQVVIEVRDVDAALARLFQRGDGAQQGDAVRSAGHG